MFYSKWMWAGLICFMIDDFECDRQGRLCIFNGFHEIQRGSFLTLWSSSLVQGPLMSSGLRTFCHLCWHCTSVRFWMRARRSFIMLTLLCIQTAFLYIKTAVLIWEWCEQRKLKFSSRSGSYDSCLNVPLCVVVYRCVYLTYYLQ